MAITFVSSSSGARTSGAGSYNVSRPSGVQDGDVLVSLSVALNISTMTDPSGWLSRSSEVLGGFKYHIAYRVVAASGSEPSSYSFTLGAGGFVAYTSIVVYRGCDASSPFATSLDSTDATSPTSLSVITDTDNALLVLFAWGGGSATFGAPSGMAENYAIDSGYPRRVWSEGQATAGESSIKSVTISGNPGAFLTALRPAGDGPPPVTARPWSHAQILE